MASEYVCFACGLSVHAIAKGTGTTWKHANGGGGGRTPAHLKHVPIVAPRTDYERAFALDTPVAEARAIIAKYRG